MEGSLDYFHCIQVDDVVHYDGSTYVVVTDVPPTNTTNPVLTAPLS